MQGLLYMPLTHKLLHMYVAVLCRLPSFGFAFLHTYKFVSRVFFASFACDELSVAVVIVAVSKSLARYVTDTAFTYYYVRRVVRIEAHMYAIIEYI